MVFNRKYFSTWTSPQAQDFLPPNDYVNINGVLHARDWVIRLVDSLTYYDPQGLNAFGQTIIGPALILAFWET